MLERRKRYLGERELLATVPAEKGIQLPITSELLVKFNSFAARLRFAAAEMGGRVWVAQTVIETDPIALISWRQVPEEVKKVSEQDYLSPVKEIYARLAGLKNGQKSPAGSYRVEYFHPSSPRREILINTPIPGEGRLMVPTAQFPFYEAVLKEKARELGGRVAVSRATFFDDLEDTLAIVSWREVKVDNLGARFVQMEGLEKDIFELETPSSRFLQKALELGLHLNKPGTPGLTRSGWDRLMERVIISTFGKAAGTDEALARQFDLTETGEIFPGIDGPVTNEAVRQSLQKGFSYLYGVSPDYLKRQYPDLLDLIVREDRFMVSKAGRTRLVSNSILGGATYQDLIEKGSDGTDLFHARIILSGYGLKVPNRPEYGQYQSLVDDLRTIKADDPIDKKQQLLERITRSFTGHYSKIFKTFCLTVSDLAKETGLHFTMQKGEFGLLLQALSGANINWGVIPYEVKSGPQQGLNYYYFILVVDKGQALAVLSKDPRLEPLRKEVVVQVGGGKLDQLPSTWQLDPKRGYESIDKLLTMLGLPRIKRGSKITMEQLLDGCPAPVFRIKSNRVNYYDISQQEQMKVFMKERYQQLRDPR